MQLSLLSIFRFNLSLQFLSSQEKETCEQLMEKLLGSLEVSDAHRIVLQWERECSLHDTAQSSYLTR